jgi:hypothetical protein
MAPALADTLDALAQTLAQAAEGLRSGSLSLETDQFQRMGLIKAGTELIDAVSLPKDKFLVWLPHLTHITALRLFIKWKAFTHIPVEDGATISYTELAAKLGADVSLISTSNVGDLTSVQTQAHRVPARIGRAHVANGSLKQVGADGLAHTEFSKMLTTPNPIWAMVQLG